MRIELAFSHGTDGNSPVVDEHGMRPLASEMRSLARLRAFSALTLTAG